MKKILSLKFIKNVFLLSLISFTFIAFQADCAKRSAEEEESDKTLAPSRNRPKRVAAAAAAAADDTEEITSSPASTSLPPIIRDHRFARATLDTSFKHMLMDDKDRTPLLSFLTAFTGINITSVNYYPTAFPVLRKEADEKQTFLDLACHDDKGRYFLVEVQVKEQKFWNPRALYYAAGIYSSQLAPGAPWKALEPVIALNILDHDRETLPDGHFRRDFQLLDREHIRDLKPGIDMEDPAQLPYLRIIQCELPRADLDTMPDCTLKQWLQLLKQSGTLQEIPAGVEEPIRKAYERLEFRRWGTKLIEDYTRDALQLEEYEGVLARKHHEGKEEGMAEGQKLAALKIARKMLDKNATIDEIIEMTELPREEIEALRDSAEQ